MPTSNDGTSLESEQDIVTAFEKLFEDKEDAEKLSNDKESDEGKPEADEAEENEEASDDEANDETTDAEEPSEDDEGNEGETEDEDAKKITKKYADDEGTYVKVKVGDEEHEVPVKELKRLFGQEASLTKKSQEVAAKTKAAEDNSAKALAALDVMVKRAQEASKPYREINWAGLMKDPNVSAEVVQALQAEAKAAIDNETFLTGQMDQFMGSIRQQQAETQRTAAAEAIKALTTEGNPSYIKGWNNDLYNGLREFAVAQGLNRDMVNQLTDPAAFKMLHMAMQFHKGSQKVVTQKVNKSPKKIVKSSTSSSPPTKAGNQLVKRKDVLAKQKKAGGNLNSTIDAFEALLAGHDD
jgi:hypothetical protein